MRETVLAQMAHDDAAYTTQTQRSHADRRFVKHDRRWAGQNYARQSISPLRAATFQSLLWDKSIVDVGFGRA
jgi:hypothetical protein